MKRVVLVIPLAVVLVFSMATLAYASGYRDPATLAGASPHTGYATTTNLCKVCHAAHGATGPEALLPSSKATACNFCHEASSPYSTKEVYDIVDTSVKASHDMGVLLNTTPDTSKTATLSGTFVCSTCHSTHGANTILAGVDILKENPAGDSPDSETVTTVDQFCADCHNKNLRESGTETYATTTHWMLAADSTTSWTGSQDCNSCHSEPVSDIIPPIEDDYPHEGTSYFFLGTGKDTTEITDLSKLDNKCLLCHRNAGDTLGVGLNF